MKTRSLTDRLALMAMAVAVTCAFGAAEARSQQIDGRASVIDGDTIDIRGQRIRFFGIDAPESSQVCKDGANQAYRCGQKSAFALADAIASRPVSCVVRDRDRYGRLVSECFVNGASLNEWMVRNGFAVAYAQYSKQFVPSEMAARAEKRGIWAGAFEMPWEYRKHHKDADEGRKAP